MKRFMTGLSVASMLFAYSAFAFDNIKIKKSEVPAAALATAEYYAPGVTFFRYAYEDEEGVRVYEFEAIDPDGRHIEVDVLADGALQEIEWEKKMDEVPAGVRASLELKYPDMQVSFIEASIRPDGSFHYEFEGVDADGDFMDVEIVDTDLDVKRVATN
ncbi:MAG: hypothetical protein COA69_04045 [Robiginitomaculum sp.]|nr:MAG: hypothetical protein COA69_04045 [Robiginitomaculum sp.]